MKVFQMILPKKVTEYFISGNKKRATKKLSDENKQTFETITNPAVQSIEIALKTPQKINCIVLKENLVKGQRLRSIYYEIVE